MAQKRAESQYQLGLYYLLVGQEKAAQKWIWYAAKEGHLEAISLLELGGRTGFFSNDTFFVGE